MLSENGIIEKIMSQAGYKTIFAIATPPGRSAIAVIRISGPLASAAPALFGAVLSASRAIFGGAAGSG
jgi:tRNA U34 5-carboxymethylaminomethyl modifying GTPase MnmE/TrmE